MFVSMINPKLDFHTLPMLSAHNSTLSISNFQSSFSSSSHVRHEYTLKTPTCLAVSSTSESEPDRNCNPKSDSKAKTKSVRNKNKPPQNQGENPGKIFPTTIPKKRRRGRRSEAAAVEDFVRNSLERTFVSIRQQNEEILEDTGNIMKERVDDDVDDDDDEDVEDEDDDDGEKKGKGMVVEEESPNWPLDADVGWGIRASEYFDQHPIRNVVGDDGFEIDWEGELDDNWVKEINCLEWESFAFHPSPLIVLVFERYNR